MWSLRGTVVLFSTITLATAQSSFQNDMNSDTSRNSISASLMNITFSSLDSTCNSSTSSEEGISIAIRTLPSRETCFDLDDIFSNPDEVYSTRGYTCENGELCGVNYTVFGNGQENFRGQMNYSQVFYTQVRNPFMETVGQTSNDEVESDDGDDDDEKKKHMVGGRLELRAFNAIDCRMVKEGGRKQKDIEWNCLAPAGECNALPFAIKSFSIAMTKPEDVGVNDCPVARESGASKVVVGGGVAWTVVMLVTIGIVLLS